jgi:ferritin-like metal-binding protein YciE
VDWKKNNCSRIGSNHLVAQKLNLRRVSVIKDAVRYVCPNREPICRKESKNTMPITTPKELCVSMLSELRHGADRSRKIYQELGNAAQNPEIKEALDARELVASQIMNKLDECFNLIGEKPAKVSQRLHDVFVEDFRRELNEIQGPVARKIFVLAKASHLAHLQVASYIALIAAADTLGHPGVGVLLESCLADKLAFMERTKRLIREQIVEKVSHA